jgi:hypothetical protein
MATTLGSGVAVWAVFFRDAPAAAERELAGEGLSTA